MQNNSETSESDVEEFLRKNSTLIRKLGAEIVSFKIGDRVKLTKPCKDNTELKVGSVGTVLENDRVPYVRWDGFTKGHDASGPDTGGAVWAVAQQYLAHYFKD